MANTTEVTKILDGPRHAVFHIYLKSDGASGDLTDFVLIDPTNVVPAKNGVPSFTIDELWYDLSGFSARLEFDYLNDDTGIWSMSSGQSNHMDFRSFGGLKDRSNPLDGSGKLLINTSGFVLAENSGTIVIKVRKD